MKENGSPHAAGRNVKRGTILYYAALGGIVYLIAAFLALGGQGLLLILPPMLIGTFIGLLANAEELSPILDAALDRLALAAAYILPAILLLLAALLLVSRRRGRVRYPLFLTADACAFVYGGILLWRSIVTSAGLSVVIRVLYCLSGPVLCAAAAALFFIRSDLPARQRKSAAGKKTEDNRPKALYRPAPAVRSRTGQGALLERLPGREGEGAVATILCISAMLCGFVTFFATHTGTAATFVFLYTLGVPPLILYLYVMRCRDKRVPAALVCYAAVQILRLGQFLQNGGSDEAAQRRAFAAFLLLIVLTGIVAALYRQFVDRHIEYRYGDRTVWQTECAKNK